MQKDFFQQTRRLHAGVASRRLFEKSLQICKSVFACLSKEKNPSVNNVMHIIAGKLLWPGILEKSQSMNCFLNKQQS